MYEFKKIKDEEILFISDNTILRKENIDYNISTILTNKRLLLLDYPSSINNYQEVLRTVQSQEYIKKKEVILSINITEINSIIEENYDKYYLNNNNYFLLKDENLKNKIKIILQK